MNVRTQHLICATIAAFAVLVAPPALAVIDLPRGTNPVFRWEPAPGPVSGYAVYSYCDGRDVATQTFSFQNTIRLYPNSCDTLVVRVAAWQFGPDGGEGALSEPSETIRFLDAGGGDTSGSTGGTDTPPDGSGGSGVLLDFDGGERSNVLMRNADTGELQLWGLENGQVVPMSALGSLEAEAWIVGNGDMNGDGNADLLHLDLDTGALGVWLIAGGAVIGGGSIADLALDWEVVGNADHDGDGRADVLLQHRTTGELELWTMNGPEILETGLLSHTQASGWKIAATGDYDGDGRADLLWHDPDAGRIDIWQMNERTLVGSVALDLDIEAPWSIVAAGDFDLDGRGDIVWLGETTREMGVCSLEAAGLRSQGILDVKLRPRASVVGAGDHDGDGFLDVLIQLGGPAGSLRALFMQGSEILGNVPIGRLPAPWFVASVGDLSPMY
jgi:hypothetical protein